MEKQELCDHKDFKAQVNTFRLSDVDDGPITGYTTELTIECLHCGVPFGFKGLERGVSNYAPMMSFDGKTARLPIVPAEEL